MLSVIPGHTLHKTRPKFAVQNYTQENVFRFAVPLYCSLMLHSSVFLNYDTVMTLRTGNHPDLIIDD